MTHFSLWDSRQGCIWLTSSLEICVLLWLRFSPISPLPWRKENVYPHQGEFFPGPWTHWISLSCCLPQFLSFKMVLINQTSHTLPESPRDSPLPMRQNSISLAWWAEYVQFWGVLPLCWVRTPVFHVVLLMGLFSLFPPHICLQEQTGNLVGSNIALQDQGDRPQWDLSQANHSYKIQYMNSEMPRYKDSGAWDTWTRNSWRFSFWIRRWARRSSCQQPSFLSCGKCCLTSKSIHRWKHPKEPELTDNVESSSSAWN